MEKKTISLQIPQSLFDVLMDIANDNTISMSAQIRIILSEYVKGYLNVKENNNTGQHKG